MTEGAAEHDGPAEEAAPAGPLARIDEAIYKVETAVVTLAALAMTITVFLDVVYRSFASPDSKIADVLAGMLGWFGVAADEGLRATLRDVVSPVLLVVLGFIAGWAMYGAARRRTEQPVKTAHGVASGAVTVLVCYGFIQFVLHVPSQWVCGILLVVGCLAVALDAQRRGDRIGLSFALIVAVGGAWGCSKLPQDYIWSRELSLMLLAWLAFIGGSMATRIDKHIAVDAAARAIPMSLRPWTRALGFLATTVFCGYIFALSTKEVFGAKGSFHNVETLPATQLPSWTVLLSMVIAFLLITIRFAARTVDAFANPHVPERKVDH